MYKALWFLLVLPFMAHGQTGIVIDSQTGQPLAFATIGLKGTSQGTISNEDGYFNIDFAEPGDTLGFSFLGYDPVEITYSSVGSIVKLERKTLELTAFTVSAA